MIKEKLIQDTVYLTNAKLAQDLPPAPKGSVTTGALAGGLAGAGLGSRFGSPGAGALLGALLGAGGGSMFPRILKAKEIADVTPPNTHPEVFRADTPGLNKLAMEKTAGTWDGFKDGIYEAGGNSTPATMRAIAEDAPELTRAAAALAYRNANPEGRNILDVPVLETFNTIKDSIRARNRYFGGIYASALHQYDPHPLTGFREADAERLIKGGDYDRRPVDKLMAGDYYDGIEDAAYLAKDKLKHYLGENLAGLKKLTNNTLDDDERTRWDPVDGITGGLMLADTNAKPAAALAGTGALALLLRKVLRRGK